MSLTLREKLRLPAGCTDSQLQEACSRYYVLYKGVLDTAKEESVKAIARARLEDLAASAQAVGISIAEADLYSWGSSTANIPASVEAELSRLSAGSQITESKANQLKKMVDSLPDCPKRHYLRALVTLRSKESSTDTYREVVGMLNGAVSADPENPVYSAMIDDIEKETQRHLNALAAWREEEQRKIDAARRKEISKKVLSGLGTVLLWVVGAAAAIAAGVFSCMCSMCESC